MFDVCCARALDAELLHAMPQRCGFHAELERGAVIAFDDPARGIQNSQDVLALHVIFHWNRIGLAGAAQATLAHAAKEAIFGEGRARSTGCGSMAQHCRHWVSW